MSVRSPLGRAAAGPPSKKRARREGRTIIFLDETGHSFRARPGTTWARRGVTPVLRRLSKRREVASVAAVTPAGRLYLPGGAAGMGCAGEQGRVRGVPDNVKKKYCSAI